MVGSVSEQVALIWVILQPPRISGAAQFVSRPARLIIIPLLSFSRESPEIRSCIRLPPPSSVLGDVDEWMD